MWDSLGPLLNAFDRFWTVKTKLFLSIGPSRLQEAFWTDFGSIWQGIWKGFARIWMGFGKAWAGFCMALLLHLNKQWADFGNAGHDLALLELSLAIGPPR